MNLKQQKIKQQKKTPNSALAQLCLVTGKGGVGKSVLATGLALQAAALQRRVALVEFETNHLATLLPKSKKITYHPIKAQEAFASYATKHLHSKLLYKATLDNRLVRYFLEAVPGAHQIIALGALQQLIDSTDYDHVIVDLPSSGHGVGWLQVPQIVGTAVKKGPFHELAQQIHRTITDPQHTHVYIPTLYEELPCIETIELAKQLENRVGCHAITVIANRVQSCPLPDSLTSTFIEYATTKQSPLVAASQFLLQRWNSSQEFAAQLHEHFGPLRCIAEHAHTEASAVAAHIAATLNCEVAP